jgi:hypothetical protein
LPRLARRVPGLGDGASLLVSSEKSALGSTADGAREKRLPSLSDGVPSAAPVPMRSGMASRAKPTNESAPSTNAAQGVQRQVKSLGIP